MMENIVILYRRLSKQFYLAGRKGDRGHLIKINSILSQIYDIEKEFWTLIKNNTLEDTDISNLDIVNTLN